MSSSSVNGQNVLFFFFLALLFFISLVSREATAVRNSVSVNTVAKSNDGIPVTYRALQPRHPAVKSRPGKPYGPLPLIPGNPHSKGSLLPSSGSAALIGFRPLVPRHPTVKSRPGKPYRPLPRIPRNPYSPPPQIPGNP